jgi:hypothetical protein
MICYKTYQKVLKAITSPDLETPEQTASAICELFDQKIVATPFFNKPMTSNFDPQDRLTYTQCNTDTTYPDMKTAHGRFTA